jgi:glutamate synthase (NADPH) small chain
MDIPVDDCYSLYSLDDHDRVNLPFYGLELRPPAERRLDFYEVVKPFEPERARQEASRCIHCPDPAGCVSACPLHNHIPDIMCLVEAGRYVEAAQVFRQTSTLPEICGRVCPQEVLCQGSCVHNARGEPVLIGAIEIFVTNFERSQKGEVAIPVGTPTGKKVAIAGGGPSGLACAERLVNCGHEVTVFDARPIPGGLLMYGIPGFKLTNAVFLKKMVELQNAGVKFVNNFYVGRDKKVLDLLAEGFDAVYISVGAGVDAVMDVPGEDLPGVYHGTEFLIRANVEIDRLPQGMTSRPELGKRVVVIGGGDTASDCLRTAIRLGAEEVTCVYRRSEAEMPGVKKDRNMARQEGVKYQFLSQPVRFIAGTDGKLVAVECVKMGLGEPDARGRRLPVIIPDSNFTIEAETAILALGYHPYPLIADTTPGLVVQRYGLVVADPHTCATSIKGVFAGGDAVMGPKLVVTAVADGQRAARSINKYLLNL